METIFIIVLVILLIISVFTKSKTYDIIYKILFSAALISMVYYAFIYPEKFYYAVLLVVIFFIFFYMKIKKTG